MPDDEVAVASITDPLLLKALAYDRIAVIQQQQGELDAINARLSELINAPPPEPAEPVHNGRVTKPRARAKGSST